MLRNDPKFVVRLATSSDDVARAQQLRYDVFVAELGSTGDGVDHHAKREADHFDAFADHILLEDAATGQLVGVYRLMTQAMAQVAGGFYSEAEFDVSPLKASGHKLLELGRSCLHPTYRGGPAMLHLWAGVADYVQANDIDTLFGVASFAGTNATGLEQPLSYLHHHHIAPHNLTANAQGRGAISMNLLPKDTIDRKAAILAIPTLIKAYLRMGGTVGQGAFIDQAFNTIDVCMILDSKAMSERAKAGLTKKAVQ